MHFKSIPSRFLRFFAAATLTMLLAVLGYFIFQSLANEDVAKPVVQTQTLPPNAAGLTAKAPVDPSAKVKHIAKSDSSNEWQYLLRPTPPVSSTTQLAPDFAELEVNRLVNAGRMGDGEAAHSLFRLAISCGLITSTGEMSAKPRSSRSGCLLLARQTESPIDWLMIASRSGDPQPLISLLGIARGMSRSNQQPQRQLALGETTIKALQDSAALGHAESFRLLWRTFSDGVITPVNPWLAFVYIDAYSKATGDATAAREALSLWSQMNLGDRASAYTLQRNLADQIRSSRSQNGRP